MAEPTQKLNMSHKVSLNGVVCSLIFNINIQWDIYGIIHLIFHK